MNLFFVILQSLVENCTKTTTERLTQFNLRNLLHITL